MKSAPSRPAWTAAHWDVLTVLFISLTAMVCLIYAVIYAYPEVLPLGLQAPTRTPTPGATLPPATPDGAAFPTFPAEWTAVFATRQPKSPSTPTALVIEPGAGPAGPTPPAGAGAPTDKVTTSAVTTTVTATPRPVSSPAASLTPVPPTLTPLPAPSPTLPAPATPLPTIPPDAYPTTVILPTWTPSQTPVGYTGYP